jgi:hypothetical protein
MSRMPVSAAISVSSACAAAPSGPASAKPAVMMTQLPTPAAAHSRSVCAHGLRHDRRRDGNDRDIDRRRVADPRIAFAPLHDVAPRVERHDLAGEAVEREIMHDAAAPFAAIVRGAEDGDAARREDLGDREARCGVRRHGGLLSGL